MSIMFVMLRAADAEEGCGLDYVERRVGGDVRAAAFATAASRWSSAFFVSIETTVAFSESKAFHSVDAL